MADCFVGEIRLLSFNLVPKGWAACNGQLLPINQNQALFSLLGTTFGGDGMQTFGLPDLRGRVPMGTSDNYPTGAQQGAETVTLLVPQLPAHSHIVSATGDPATADDPTGNALALSADATYGATPNAGPMGTSSFSPAGGSQPYTNMQPSLVVSFCIALQGIFPTRS